MTTSAAEPRLLASLTSLDGLTLGTDCTRLLAAGVDGLHIDIADGHFVPFLTYAPGIVRSIRSMTDAFLDVHLLVADPAVLVPQLLRDGADRVAFHVETTPWPWRLATSIREGGAQASIAIGPATPVDVLRLVSAAVDMVNVQSSTHEAMHDRTVPGIDRRISEVRELLPAGTALQVDGGVDAHNAAAMVRGGATEIVVGRAICGETDWSDAVARIRRAARTSP